MEPPFPSDKATLLGQGLPGESGGPTAHAPGHESFAATMAQDSSAPAPTAAPSARPASAGLRTSVLPKVTLGTGQPDIRVEQWPRYEPVRLLGEGGMGSVMLARDHDIARSVAIKRLHPALQSSPAALHRFVEEVRTVGRLEHPNIIPIHDVGQDPDGSYYFVMKRVEGETLEDIIAHLAGGDRAYHARFGFEARVRIFMDVLEAIAHAHAQGVLHRDIKPANVMVSPDGVVTVMDWGIAKRLDQGLAGEPGLPAAGGNPAQATLAGSLIGTPAYMAPEQTRGEPATVRSEVYSLCLLFYELLTLKHPFARHESLEQLLQAVQEAPITLAGMVPSRHQIAPPMDLTWFLKKGLSKDPARRYATVMEMIIRLQLRAEGIVPIQCHITFTQRLTGMLQRFANRNPVLFTMIAGAALLAGLAGGLFTMLGLRY